MVYEGRAVGGPLDRVKLTAQASWNGRIPKEKSVNKAREHVIGVPMYPGHYTFDMHIGKWVWIWDSPKRIEQVTSSRF